MKIGFIGAGKVGFTLGKYFTEHGVSISGYYSQNPLSAKEAAAFTNTRSYETLERIVEDSDTLFLTVPDGQIKNIWDCMRQLFIVNKIICHCSGLLSSAVFSGINEAHAYGYSIHPLFAVNHKLTSYKELSQAFFTIEGNETYLDKMISFVEYLGNPVQVISKEDKPLYHAAAVLVSNQVQALVQQGESMLMQCGFSKKQAEKALMPLFLNNALHIEETGIEKSLTGPIERNDVDTVKMHLNVLKNSDRELYILLSKKLVEIAMEKHPERSYKEMKKELI